MTIDGGAHHIANFGEILPHIFLEIIGQRRIARGDRIIRRALKHGQVLGGGGHHRNGLNAGGTRANHANALAREIHAFMRPFASVVPFALKIRDAINFWQIGRRKAADGGDQIARRIFRALFRAQAPQIGGLIILRRHHARAEGNVALQVKLIRGIIQIAQNLRLARVAFGPFPALHQLIRKMIAIAMAFGITPRPGIAVPIPGTAHAITGFQHMGGKPLAVAQGMELIHAGETGADDQRVIELRLGRGSG